MVDSERLEEWVGDKLESGVDPERVKQSLRETGHDPSIVDEVRDPFNSAEEEREQEDSPGKEDMKQELESSEDPGSKEETDPNDAVGEERGSIVDRVRLPALSVSTLVVAVIVVAGAAGYFLIPWSSLGLPSGIDASRVGGSGDSIPAAATEGCPDVGVRIESVSTSGGKTTAEVEVTRGTAYVTLDVYRGGSKVGSDTKEIGGHGSITVGATGDEAVFHPYGCGRYRDSRSIG